MELREATIIVPSRINGVSTAALCAREIDRIVKRWGGATLTSGGGAWVSPTSQQCVVEEVGIITCAMTPTPENNDAWRIIAVRLGRLLNQESMYCKLASGSVEFIDPVKADDYIEA